MGALAIVLAVQSNTGSFAVAGTASGAFGFANVVAAPTRARLLDLWGPCWALTLLGWVQALALGGLAVAAHVQATPAGSFVALAVLAGLVWPPLGAVMRTLWTRLTSEESQRTRAFSLDAIADDVVFVVGPVAAATLAAVPSPSSALLTAAVAMLLGTLGLATSPAARTLSRAIHRSARADRPLRHPGFPRVLVVLMGIGFVLGTIEVAAPAVALSNNARADSGWLLAAMSAGSAAGGAIYAQVRWSTSLGARMLLLAAGMGALTCGVAFAGSVTGFGVGLAVIGMFLTPSIVTGYLAAERLVSPQAFTEAAVWTNTSLNVGAAVANAAAGAVIARAGASAAMLAAGLLGVAAASCAPLAILREAAHRD